jgi:5'-nucleotidase
MQRQNQMLWLFVHLYNDWDVVLLSRNSADTGLRIFNSIEHYDLNIAKAAFTRGESTHTYLDEFDADLFLSSHYKEYRHCCEKAKPHQSVFFYC